MVRMPKTDSFLRLSAQRRVEGTNGLSSRLEKYLGSGLIKGIGLAGPKIKPFFPAPLGDSFDVFRPQTETPGVISSSTIPIAPKDDGYRSPLSLELLPRVYRTAVCASIRLPARSAAFMRTWSQWA